MLKKIIEELIPKHQFLLIKFREYFVDRTFEHSRENDNRFIQRELYASPATAEFMILHLFMLVQLLESLPEKTQLSVIRALQFSLVETLPWAQSKLSLRNEVLDEKKIKALMRVYYHEVSGAPELLESTANHTLFAYTALNLMSDFLRQMSTVLPADRTSIEHSQDQLNKAKKSCAIYLSSKSVNNKHQFKTACIVFDSFKKYLSPDVASVSSPPQRIAQAIKKIFDIRLVQQSLDKVELIQLIESSLQGPTEKKKVDILLPLIMNWAATKPPLMLDFIWRESDWVGILIELILQEDARKAKICFSWLLTGFRDPNAKPKYHFSPPLFDLLFDLYDRELKTGIIFDELIDQLLKCEPCIPVEEYAKNCLAIIIDRKDFELAFALTLSTISDPGLNKPLVYSFLKTHAIERDGIAVSWFNLLKKTTLPDPVIKHFNNLFQITFRDLFLSDVTVVNQLLDSALDFHRRYHQAVSTYFEKPSLVGKPNQLLRDLGEQYQKFCKPLLDQENILLSGILSTIQTPDREKFTNVLKRIGSAELTDNHRKWLLQTLINSNFILDYFNDLIAGAMRINATYRTRKKTEKKNIGEMVLPHYLDLDDVTEVLRIFGSAPFPSISCKNENKSAEPRANLLIAILVLVSSRRCEFFTESDQENWRQLMFAILRQVLNQGHTEPLGQIMLDLIPACDVCSFLPEPIGQKFRDLTLKQERWVEDDAAFEQLLQSLLEDEQPKKTTKGKRKKKAVQPELPAKPIEPVLVADKKFIAVEHPSDAPLLSLTHFRAVMDAKECDDMMSSLTDREMVTPTSTIDTDSAIEVLTTRPDKIRGVLQKKINKIHQLVDHLLHQTLPLGWTKLITQAASMLIAFNKEVGHVLAILPESDIIQHRALGAEALMQLEKDWNEALADLCWNIQRDIEKRVEIQKTDEALRVETAMQTLLLGLSDCYFKNPAAYLHHDLNVFLQKLVVYFSEKGFRVAIKGSYFFAPDDAGDLDLIFTPQEIMTAAMINECLAEFMLKTPYPMTPVHLFTSTDLFQYQVMIDFGSHFHLDVDLNFLFQPLSLADELKRTADSILSTCAVHWYLDGHALMLPQTARAICDSHPVLTLLKSFTELELIQMSGYLFKNIAKFEHVVRIAPVLRDFMARYLLPSTRYASVFVFEPQHMSDNQQVVMTALQYLFTRFHRRTDLNIRFILQHELLHVVLPLPRGINQLCAENFRKYWMSPESKGFSSTMHSTTFLALFLLSGMIEQSSSTRDSIFAALREVDSIAGVNIQFVIAILHRAPKSSYEFYCRAPFYQRSDVPLQQLPIVERSVVMIFQLWAEVISKKSQSHGQAAPMPTLIAAPRRPFIFFPPQLPGYLPFDGAAPADPPPAYADSPPAYADSPPAYAGPRP